MFGGHGIGKGSMFKKKPSAEFHLASKRFMDTFSKSRLAHVSKIAVGVDVIAFVDSKEVKGTVRFTKDKKVYMRELAFQKQYTPQNGSKAGGCLYDTGNKFMSVEEECYTYEMIPIPVEAVRHDPKWIRKVIEENRPYGLPIFINSEVFKGIVADLIDEQWRAPAEALLDYTAELL